MMTYSQNIGQPAGDGNSKPQSIHRCQRRAWGPGAPIRT